MFYTFFPPRYVMNYKAEGFVRIDFYSNRRISGVT